MSRPVVGVRPAGTQAGRTHTHRSRPKGGAMQRTIVRVGLGVAVAGLIAGGVAWACVPQPAITVSPRASGPPESRAKITGISFRRAAVEIRWNSPSGPVLGRAAGPQFTTEIAVPDAAPGLYTLVAVARAPDGGIAGVATAPYLVSAPGDDGDRVSVPAPGVGRRAPPAPQRREGAAPWAYAAGGAAAALALAGAAALAVRAVMLRSRPT